MLKPVVEKEVPKVVQAVRQTSNRKVLFKLLTRIKVGGQPSGVITVTHLFATSDY